MSNIQKQQGTSSLAQFKNLLDKDDVKKKFTETLGKDAPMFISNLVTVMSGSDQLQKCEHTSIISSSMLAASMKLPILPALGFAGIVPFWDNKTGTNKAQFQIFKKGLIQLAQRTGQFKLINVTKVYEGEIKTRNRFTGEFEFDENGKTSDKVVGYVSYFKLINGFENYYYMTIEEIEKHAQIYSQSYKKGYGKWADKEKGGFEQMCEKTVLKLNLSNYAPLRTDEPLQKAIQFDQAEIKNMDATDIDYFDNENSQEHQAKEVFENANGTTHVIKEGDQQKGEKLTKSVSDKINKVAEEAVIVPNTEAPVAESTSNIQQNINFDSEGKKYTEDELLAMKPGQLMNIINSSQDMMKAVDIIEGKNTPKKLRTIIIMWQLGKLDDHIKPYLENK